MEIVSQSQKHRNYELLNLLGYGLAKFDTAFVKEFGFKTKTDFYKYIVQLNVADTVGTVKNRQDLFDPFFDNKRKGWWQKGNAYIHRKILIDSLFEKENVSSFSNLVKLYLTDYAKGYLPKEILPQQVSPIIKSKFKQLQTTGQEAELFFLYNYQGIEIFKEGKIEDARLFGDGYDFQVEVSPHFYLAEVKGLNLKYGSIRLTKNEYDKAAEYNDFFVLVVVSNLSDVPKMKPIINPIKNLKLTPKSIHSKQIAYHSQSLTW
ncbi:MAG TPA: DUF3883 domain-containing protein [Chitinophagales bacterium]|nr:DUF3883 domain-containing protein [Chitinophagales bacterium]